MINIKQCMHDYNKFNKLAAGEGLRYLSMEFDELNKDVNSLLLKYFKLFRGNKREVSNTNTLNIIHYLLEKFRNDLNNYHNESSELFFAFKRSIVKHDRKKLVKIFGKDYVQYMDEIFPGRDISSGPKYKAMMELVEGDDKQLMEKALDCLGMLPTRYGEIYQEVVLYFNKIFGKEKTEEENYDWVAKYSNLFKFAAIPSFFDVRHLFPGKGQSVEFGEEYIGVSLTEAERNILEKICSTWNEYSKKFEKYVPLLQRSYVIDKAYLDTESKRNEELHNIFDRIRALKYMVESYIKDGENENLFKNMTGFNFKNALAKIDGWVYVLLKTFPSSVVDSISKKFVSKLPRTIIKEPKLEPKVPEWTETETNFFDRGKKYEEGEISGTEENGDEILFREQKETTPKGYLSSYVPAFQEAIQMIKKSTKK